MERCVWKGGREAGKEGGREAGVRRERRADFERMHLRQGQGCLVLGFPPRSGGLS